MFRSAPPPPPGSVGRAARVGTDGCAACGAGRSVGCPDPQICFAALRAAGRSVGHAESETPDLTKVGRSGDTQSSLSTWRRPTMPAGSEPEAYFALLELSRPRWQLLLSASCAAPRKAGSTSHGAQSEHRTMLRHAPAHPPAITTTSDRPSGLHPIRHAQGAILGLLGAPARRCDVTPSP